MAKLDLQLVTNANQPTVINNNSTLIETAVENTLSRDGTTPNQMLAPLDMNNQKIVNLAAPSASTDAARLIDFTTLALPSITIPSLVGQEGRLLTTTDGATLAWAIALGDGGDTFTYRIDQNEFVIEDQDAGALLGPELVLYRNSASQANNDFIGRLLFRGKDGAGTPLDVEYGHLQVQVLDSGQGTEDAILDTGVMVAGTLTRVLRVQGAGVDVVGNIDLTGVLDVPTGNLQINSVVVGATAAELNENDRSAIAISNYQAVLQGHIYNDSSSVPYGQLTVSASMATGAWESWGPTSSGANNEDADLLVGAKGYVIEVRGVMVTTGAGAFNYNLYARPGDTTWIIGTSTNVSSFAGVAVAGSETWAVNDTFVIATDLGDDTFDMYYTETNCTVTLLANIVKILV